MKKIIMGLLLLSCTLLAFEGALVKSLYSVFGKSTVNLVSKQYGETGLNALKILSKKYGKDGIKVFESVSAKYGEKGVQVLSRYGEIAVKNKASFEMASKYGDEGFYLLKQYPQSVKQYEKFGERFIVSTQKFGDKRVVNYLGESAKFGQDGKVMNFLEKFGEKANIFLDRHWGKLLTSGFVLLNADNLVQSMENVSTKAVDKTGDVATKSVEHISNSNLGIFIGIALLLFVFFKYGLDFIFGFIERWRNGRKGKNF